MHSLYINDQWEKQVLQSGYLSHVRALLSAAKKMAQMLNSGTCVVTQSSIKDGYDLLECALVSLALVLLDPYYRTTHGFIVLIEKEWNQFAFPFHPTKVTEGKHIRKVELAPVFILFLDCVWQIYKEMPAAFQFNERFLIFLADQSIFSRFGTFLFGIDRNSIQDSNDTALHAQRLEHERIIKTGAVSAWDYVSFHKEKFVNVLYAPYCTFLAGTHLVRVQLWQAYFLRYTTSANKMDFWRQVNHLRATNGENLYLQALKLPNMMELETSALRLFHDVKSIDLSSNFLNCYPVELLLSTKLSKLNLQKNRLKAFPPSAFVAHMTDLLELILATNQIDALPPMVTMFSSLTILKLGSNKIENIEHLGVLTSLIHLDLSENCIVSVPNNVSALQSLQELLLSKNMLSTFPENISSMTSLRELSLSFNRFSTVPSGIYQLTSLQALELQKNKIESLSNDLLKLQYLRVLNFSENRISTFPHALCSLDSLGRLDLGRNELTSLPPNISRMTNLVQLILDGNKISEIPLEIGALMSLTELNLHDNLLTEIPPSIGQLMSLRTLELRGNAINYLPHTVGLLSHTLRHFAVDACAVAHLPQFQPILARGADEILRYMQEYMQLDKISYTTKMVLLGNEDSGKTSLMNSLLKKFKKSSECCATAPTPGINVESWKFNLRDSSADTVNVHVWDLGGQERYRTAHQLLLPQACVNIIAWNVLQGTSLDYFESAIEYWIRFLCARIVDARPIIFIVATHIDHPNAPRNRKAILHDILIRYKEMFPGFDIYSASVGCTTGQGISDLRKDIQTVIYAKLMQNKPIPTSWQLLERTLITERAKRNIPIMNGSELGRLCQACGMENPRGIRRALWWLHNNSNFCFLEPLDGPSLENVPVAVNSHGIAILDPQWLCANFSTIFSARRSWSINKGYDELGEIWKFPESDANVPQLLATAATFFLDFQMTKLQQFDVID